MSTSRSVFRACLILVAALHVGVLAASAQQAPDGYHLVQGPELPDSLHEVTEEGRFLISVLRRAATSTELELIERAESLYPDEALIRAAQEDFLSDPRNRLEVWAPRFAEAEGGSEPRWWWVRGDPAYTPFAITHVAVAHYMDAVRRYGAGPNPFERYASGYRHRARFEYEAHVAPSEGSGHAVELRLLWSHRCAIQCGFGISLTRRVEFGADGTVLSVKGDGLAEVVVL